MADKEATKVFSVRLNRMRINFFKAYAIAKRITMTQLINEAVTEYINNHPLTDSQNELMHSWLRSLQEEDKTQ